MSVQTPTDAAAAERQAFHEAWMRLATPGEAHRRLDPFVGTWNARTKVWFDPSQPPAESTGRMVNTWAAGGRFVRQDYRSEGPMGVFEGAGFFGHDNQTGRYVGVWVDVMSTAIMRHDGTYDEASRTFTMRGTFTDPAGRTLQNRQTFRVVSNDEHVFEAFQQCGSEPERKTLEVVYTRAG